MGLSLGHILLVVVLFLLLFGRGKLPALMSDVAEGIKSFRKSIQEDRQVPDSSHNDEKGQGNIKPVNGQSTDTL